MHYLIYQRRKELCVFNLSISLKTHINEMSVVSTSIYLYVPVEEKILGICDCK